MIKNNILVANTGKNFLFTDSQGNIVPHAKITRNKSEVYSIAAAIQAIIDYMNNEKNPKLLKNGSIDYNSNKALEILFRRLETVLLAEKNGNWDHARLLSHDATSDSLLSFSTWEEMSRMAKIYDRVGKSRSNGGIFGASSSSSATSTSSTSTSHHHRKKNDYRQKKKKNNKKEEKKGSDKKKDGFAPTASSSSSSSTSGASIPPTASTKKAGSGKK